MKDQLYGNLNMSLKFWKGETEEEDADEKLKIVNAFAFKANTTKIATVSKRFLTGKLGHLYKILQRPKDRIISAC